MARSLQLAVAAVLVLFLVATVAGSVSRSAASGHGVSTRPSGTYEVKFESGIKVTMTDGIKLNVDGFIPIPRDNTTKFPVIICPNSWATPIIEYLVKTYNYAQDGYIAIEYETRGWYTSGGEIDAAGPQDLSDAQHILDYVLSRPDWQVDEENIAFMGISYGAGISQTVGGADPRVKTVIALSGWWNITKMIMPYNTPNLVWGSLLEISAEIVGHPSADIKQLYADAMAHRNLSWIDSYCAPRSPGRFLDTYNQRQLPVFISHNRLDRLFRSEWQMDMFTQLNYTDKFMMINQGIHAEPEIFGLVDLGHNKIFDNVRMWVDHYLMGKSTDITQMPKVQMQLGDTITDQTYVAFDTWPSSVVQREKLTFGARGSGHYGSLSGSLTSTELTGDESISYTGIPCLTAGTPIATALVRSIGIPYDTEVELCPTSENMIYRSGQLPQDTRYCGVPEITITVSANKPSWQVYAFLYDIDELDIAYLVTNTYYSHYGAEDSWSGVPTTVTLQFHTACKTFPKGHRVGVGFVLYSSLYKQANTDDDLSVTFHYNATNELVMPLNPN